MNERRPSGSNFGTFIALAGLLAVTGGLLFLAALVHPAILGVLVVILAFGLIGVLHYFLWGWWLGRVVAEEDEDMTRRP